jgi:hypothetical protein
VGIRFSLVPLQDGTRPHDKVSDPLAGRLLLRPQFKILWTIVCPVTIHMVDVLIRSKRAPQFLGHHQPMNEHRSRFALCVWMRSLLNHDIPTIIDPGSFTRHAGLVIRIASFIPS